MGRVLTVTDVNNGCTIICKNRNVSQLFSKKDMFVCLCTAVNIINDDIFAKFEFRLSLRIIIIYISICNFYSIELKNPLREHQ